MIALDNAIRRAHARVHGRGRVAHVVEVFTLEGGSMGFQVGELHPYDERTPLRLFDAATTREAYAPGSFLAMLAVYGDGTWIRVPRAGLERHARNKLPRFEKGRIPLVIRALPPASLGAEIPPGNSCVLS